jgi:hypothetical protein
MTHTCKVCGVTSDAAEFYNRVNNRCKECHKKNVKENREAKADYYRDYDAKRFQEDPRVKDRHKSYQKTDAGKASITASRKKWLNQSPEKRAAHVILGNAVRDGRIEKPDHCSKCGKKEVSRRIHAHHHDYTKPVDVTWLCTQCHKDEHKD